MSSQLLPPHLKRFKRLISDQIIAENDRPGHGTFAIDFYFIKISLDALFCNKFCGFQEATLWSDRSGSWGWSGGMMVLGKLPVPGRPTIWISVGQGPTALTVGAGGGVVWTFLLSSILSLLFLPLFGRRPDID